MKTKKRLSRDQPGSVSSLSEVNVICRLDATPADIETRCRSIWDFAACQSGVATVYGIHWPFGLGVHEPGRASSWTSMNVIGRSAWA